MSVTVAANLTGPDEVQQFKLGDVLEENGNTWVYIQAGSAITRGALLLLDKAFKATPVTTTSAGATINSYGVAQWDIADNEYSWVPVGPFNVRSNGTEFVVDAEAACAEGALLNTTATAGRVDDAATTPVYGLVLKATVGGAAALTPCRAVQRIVTV